MLQNIDTYERIANRMPEFQELLPDGTNLWEHTKAVIQLVRPDKVSQLAALFHDISKPNCDLWTGSEIIYPRYEDASADYFRDCLSKHFSLTEDEKEGVEFIIRYHGVVDNPDQINNGLALFIMRSKWIFHLIDFQRANALAKVLPNGEHAPVYTEKLEAMELMYRPEEMW